ncbi:hypothetical protein [Acinetobacter ursingii]|uniref:hypothetical protein n=1 Tax=Acinetobacter ursingii TaxID=108980 RepID=UPI00124FA0D0|nr:hypothetical protein [Acinetobacter ursingii]
MNSMVQMHKQVKLYDAGDLADAHALAQSQLSWIASLVSTVKANVESNKTYHNLELLEIAQYLAESFKDEHADKAHSYESESSSA